MARILLVEDELLIIEDLRQKVRRLGHTVVGHATTGEAAVQKAAELRPDLVLMDVRLRGEMNGIEATRRIREVNPIPVVYVTAQVHVVAAEIDGQKGLFSLTKPFTTGQLDAVITAACSA